MTGKGHRMTGLAAAFFAAAVARKTGTPELIAASVALFSITLPDWLEIPLYRRGMRAGTVIPHRTITHWPPLWLCLIWYCAQLGGAVGALGQGAAVGALMHILGDAPNPMGIPWLLPNQRIRFGKKGLWRSGQNETLMVIVFTIAGYATWRLAGGVLHF